MTPDQLIDRYETLYDKMKESKDPRNMKIFGEAEKYMFKEIALETPAKAERWLSHLEAICWNNFLSEKEAMNISATIKNQDGSVGFKWNLPTFEAAIASMGGHIEHKPTYNKYALWATMNMIYSDHAKSISEDMGFSQPSEVPTEKMAKSCYHKALEKLSDPDRPSFVRKYFKHEMYNRK